MGRDDTAIISARRTLGSFRGLVRATSLKLVCLHVLVSVLAPRPNLCLGVLAPLRLDSEAAKRKDVGPGVGEEGAVGGSVRIGPLRTNEVGIGIGSPGSSEDWVSCRPNLFKFPLTNLLVSRQTSSPIRASRLPLRRPFILFPRPKSDQTKAAIFKSYSSPFRIIASGPLATRFERERKAGRLGREKGTNQF